MKVAWNNQLKAIVITIVFFVVAIIGAIHHEPWRDEIQAWLIAIDATSLSGLYENCRYEGHPMLWHLLLYGISLFSHNIFYMQLLSVCIGAVSVFIFCRFSPFSWLQKILFSFGFYALFQYSILSRSYGLVLLFMILWTTIYYSNRASFWGWIVLGLLANTSATGFVLAGSFAGFLIFARLIEKLSIKDILKQNVAGLLVLFVALLLSAWQIYPEANNIYQSRFSIANLQQVFTNYHDAFFYAGYWPQLFSWSTVFMRETHLLDGLLSLVLFVLSLVFLSKSKNVLFFYVLSTLVLLVLLASSNMFSARFIGHFFLIFLIANWMFNKENEHHFSLNFLTTLALFFQLIMGATLYISDYQKEFSSGKKVWEIIQEKKLENKPIIGALDYTVSPISYWSSKRLFCIETRTFESFIKWNTQRGIITPELLLSETDSLLNIHQQAVVVLSTYLPISYESFNHFLKDTIESSGSEWVLIQKIDGALVPDENYYLYIATKNN